MRLIITLYSLITFSIASYSQVTWDNYYDKNPKWISLIEKHFGSEFEYIGTRNIKGPPQVLLLDRKSIVKKGNYLQSTYYQVIIGKNGEDGGGVFMKFVCDCDRLRMKMIYIGSLDGRIGEKQYDNWKTGISDGLTGRIVSSTCY